MRTEVIEWKAFMNGEVKPKTPRKFNVNKTVSVAVTLGALTLLHDKFVIDAETITALAQAPSFQEQISVATKPIKDVIFGFAGEIYFVFMAWGALEALIGKPQQGFTRMKVATGAYILLYWVPWIVDQVNNVRPAL